MLRVNIEDSNLTLRDRPTNWGGGVSLYNGQLLTGVIYEYYPNTNQLSDECEYRDGIPDGRQVQYWENGNMKEEYFAKYDNTYGSFKTWNEQGVLTFYAEYDQFGNLIKRIV